MANTQIEHEAACQALAHAMNLRADGDSAAKTVTNARRFYKFLSNPEGGSADAAEE